MSEVNFTLDDVVAKVREVAAERPDYVYEKPAGAAVCRYRHGDEPGCIVGQALDRLGFAVPKNLEGKNSTVVLAQRLGVGGYVSGVAWVRTVQGEQDSGASWGDAVESADSYIRLLTVA